MIVSEMEDTIAEGFKGHRQLLFAHWICFILMRAIDRMAPESALAMRNSPTTFREYDMRQLMGQRRGNRVARQPHQRAPVPESVEEHDEAIRGLAEIELADLEAQQDDPVPDDLLSDSTDEDYKPLPRMPPWAHDYEAEGSSLAPQAPQTDPTLLAILDRMQRHQERKAEEQQRQATA